LDPCGTSVEILREKRKIMRATKKLQELGQSLWLDNVTRDLLDSRTLSQYIAELSVTGLTSNPTIFNRAIGSSAAYDVAIQKKVKEGKSGEELFFELALDDLGRAADLLGEIHERTCGVDGWVSLEVSPLIAHNPEATVAEARSLHARARRSNVYIKIPGNREGLVAIEEATFAGVPVNVTLLFSVEQYVAAADAYLRGLERRIAARLPLNVSSVASVFISRWDTAVAGKVPDDLTNKLGIAIGRSAYKAYRELMATPRWQIAFNAGARPQRLLFASTGTKDPTASDILYVRELAAPLTITTVPEATLQAFATHGEVNPTLSADSGDAPAVLIRYAAAGIDYDALGAKLQDEGAISFTQSWNEMLTVIASKSASLR
jgi:transaldolase